MTSYKKRRHKHGANRYQWKTKKKSKGSVSQLMDDLDLINSVEQVEVMVNSRQKGVENVLRK